MRLKAILDASPIIAFFDELREPDILLLTRGLGYELLLPYHVWRFDILKDPAKTTLSNCIEDGEITTLPPLDPARLNRFMSLHPSLGAGESEVILNAVQIASIETDVLCILDDLPARHAAQQSDLHVTGTIGLIDALSKAGLIDSSKCDQLKTKLAGSRFRVDKRLLR